MGVGGQLYATTALPPGMTRYPLYRTLGGPQGRSGWLQKISPPPGFNLRTVQPVVNRYTDCAVPAHVNVVNNINIHGSVMLCIGYCFRTSHFCSCHHPVFEHQTRVASTVRKCSGASFLLLLRFPVNNLAICTVNPSKDYKNPNSLASL